MFQVQKYMIGQHFVCPLEYGDMTGINDSEESELDQFVAALPGTGHWSWGEQAEFAKCEVSGQMGACVEAEWVYNTDEDS